MGGLDRRPDVVLACYDDLCGCHRVTPEMNEKPEGLSCRL